MNSDSHEKENGIKMKTNSYKTRAKRVSLLCKYIALSDGEMGFQRLESDLTAPSRESLRQSIQCLQSVSYPKGTAIWIPNDLKEWDEVLRELETFAQDHLKSYDPKQGLDIDLKKWNAVIGELETFAQVHLKSYDPKQGLDIDLYEKCNEVLCELETFAQYHPVLYDPKQGLDKPVCDLYKLKDDYKRAFSDLIKILLYEIYKKCNEALGKLENFAQDHPVLYDPKQGLDNPVFDLYKLKDDYKRVFSDLIKILFSELVLEISPESDIKIVDKEEAVLERFIGYRDEIDRFFFSKVSSSELIATIDTGLDSGRSSVESPKPSLKAVESLCSKVCKLRRYISKDIKALGDKIEEDKIEIPLIGFDAKHYIGPVTVNEQLGIQTLPDGDCGLHVVTFAILDPGNGLKNEDLSNLELLLGLEKDSLIDARQTYKSIFLYAMGPNEKVALVKMQQRLAPVWRWFMVNSMLGLHRGTHRPYYLPYVDSEVDRLKNKYLGQKVDRRDSVAEGFPVCIQDQLINTAKELAANDIFSLSDKNDAVMNKLHRWWRTDGGGYEAYCISLAKDGTYLQPLDLNVLAKSLGFRGFSTLADGRTLYREEGVSVSADISSDQLLEKHLTALREVEFINGADNIIVRQSDLDLARLPERIQHYYTEKGQTGLEESECRALMHQVSELHASAFRDKEKPLICAHFSGDHWTYIRQFLKP